MGSSIAKDPLRSPRTPEAFDHRYFLYLSATISTVFPEEHTHILGSDHPRRRPGPWLPAAGPLCPFLRPEPWPARSHTEHPPLSRRALYTATASRIPLGCGSAPQSGLQVTTVNSSCSDGPVLPLFYHEWPAIRGKKVDFGRIVALPLLSPVT